MQPIPSDTTHERRRLPWLVATTLLLAASAACVAEPTPPLGDDDDDDDSAVVDDDDDITFDDDDTADDDDDSGLSGACEPALSLEEAELFTVPFGSLTLQASGGTGQYHFEIVENASGAIVEATTGFYLAGELRDVVDVVELTDLGCEGSVSADVTVLPDIDVRPTWIRLLPNTSFTYEIEGGSDSFQCSMLVEQTGATVSAGCTYSATSTEGVDLVRVTDDLTGEFVDSTIVVDADAELVAHPAHVVIPLGSVYALRIDGGSDHFDLTNQSGSGVSYADGLLSADSAGTVQFNAVDHFTGESLTLYATAVASQAVPVQRAGDLSLGGFALAPGDVDGDGYDDAILGVYEMDLGYYNNGGVLLWLGGPSGLQPSPARTWPGGGSEDWSGYAGASGDFDADGLVDLAIGAPRSDFAAVDAGQVAVYMGEAGQPFEDSPSRTFGGDYGYDYFGYAADACDYNGDGYDDLAVGAARAEDRDSLDISYSQGAVYVFLGGPDGLPLEPSDVVYGQLPDGGGGFVGLTNFYLGSMIESGDINGDGLCDMAVGAWEVNSSDGAVALYFGRAGDALSAGGITPWPMGIISADPTIDAGSQFGRALDVGDLNDDGLADILVGERAGDAPPNNTSAGIVWAFAGTEISEPLSAPVVNSSVFSAVWIGDNAWDTFGTDVEVADFDGDGLNDLLVGSPFDEIDGGPGSPGTVLLHPGLAGGWPDVAHTGAVAWGLQSIDSYGQYLATLGDVDGDGLNDLLSFSGRDDSLGLSAGRPFYVPGDGSLEPIALDFPGDPSGQQIGPGVAVLGDVTGDGWEDFLVGAPGYDIAEDEINIGGAFLYPGGPSGPDLDAGLELGGFPGHSNSDDFGFWSSAAGDFNGDGTDDFSVIGRYDDPPATFSSDYVNADECPGAETNPGGVHIFLGSDSGMPSGTPAFVHFGPGWAATMWTSDGGFDANGDGLDDLLLGYPVWDPPGRTNAGGVELIYGRAADPSGITVICEPDWALDGGNGDDRMGQGIAGLGDLDGDGCDEFAVGAYQEDGGITNQGTVRVIWGWGATCSRSGPEQTLLASADVNARAGYSLSGGHDVDGDGLPDLAIGAYTVQTELNNVGAAWIVPGSYILGLPTESVDPAGGTEHSLAVAAGTFRVTGEAAGEQFGRSVALVPGLSSGGRAGLLVGGPLGDVGGSDLSGGARIYEFDTSPSSYGLNPVPVAALGGETDHPFSYIGEEVAAGSLGGAPWVIVGGYRADGDGVETGAAYAFPAAP